MSNTYGLIHHWQFLMELESYIRQESIQHTLSWCKSNSMDCITQYASSTNNTNDTPVMLTLVALEINAVNILGREGGGHLSLENSPPELYQATSWDESELSPKALLVGVVAPIITHSVGKLYPGVNHREQMCTRGLKVLCSKIQVKASEDVQPHSRASRWTGVEYGFQSSWDETELQEKSVRTANKVLK
ncbi:hypothetical protein ARMGADRAFT_1022896 [Armillaria gallica]|uniref:Uncharacterized protein n=1 Tax=Armillaria gallica TaxID=47427 RepID=A0A2H3EER2_ARMGA|nr:hypothetical protein ARMGADRAFT_1022896 [Armillaria gallica]